MVAKNIWSNEDIDKLKKLIEQKVSYTEIGIELKRSEGAIANKINSLGLVTYYSNSPKYKAIYQNFDWCYEHFVNQGMSHKEMADLAGCKKRTIEKWCVEIHKINTYSRMNNKTINSIQHDLIVGSLLGDGHIDKRENFPLFIVSHAENQKDYLYYKYDIMKNLCNMTPTKYDGKVKLFSNGNEYQCQNSYRFNTRTYTQLDKYRKLTKLDLAYMLNDYSLAIWILDDGYYDKKKGLWELCSAMMNKDENETTLKYLYKKFNIYGRIQKDVRYIRFDVPSSKIINNIILNNIPNNLDIIQYKIINEGEYE